MWDYFVLKVQTKIQKRRKSFRLLPVLVSLVVALLILSCALCSPWLYAHAHERRQTITLIMLVQWKQQMKLRIIKKVDYSPCFGCYSFVVAVCYMLTIVVCSCCCALVDYGCVLMLMKENQRRIMLDQLR